MKLTWQFKEFDQLSPHELYSILQLRINVFMLEQNSLYRDCDNKDLDATHLYAMEQNKLVAYARLLPEGISYPELSIGRVVIHPDFRKLGLGGQLMEQAIHHLHEKFSSKNIRISAQAHLQKFYKDLGFITVGEVYLEDNIPHVEMLLSIH